MLTGRLFTTEKYAAAFAALSGQIDTEQWQMLRAFLNATQHTLTATAAAEAAGFKTYRSFNARFGALSLLFCDYLEFDPPNEWDGKPYKTSVLAILEKKAPSEQYRWRLRPEVVEYLRTTATGSAMSTKQVGPAPTPAPTRPATAGSEASATGSVREDVTARPCADALVEHDAGTTTQDHPGSDDEKNFRLVGADGKPVESKVRGTLGGYRPKKIYGRLDCSSAKRWIDKGEYVRHRVFFADEPTAICAGYRPCSNCMPTEYAAWKARQQA